MGLTTPAKIKHQHIYEALHKSIIDGNYQDGQQLPTEAELAQRFSSSRPTVAKAMSRLQKAGLVERRVGSGTFVRYSGESTRIMSFGLLIPGLGETEIFETICGHMAHMADEKQFSLIWNGSMADDAKQRRRHLEHLATRYVQQKVDGVFFAPLELTSDKDTINTRISKMFDAAGIPVVLMDRDIVAFPARSKYDWVGVDNFRIGFLITKHLIEHGYAHIRFVARPYSAHTVRMRLAGCREALRQTEGAGTKDDAEVAYIGDVDSVDFVRNLVREGKSLGIVCANDTTAAKLMHRLSEMGYDIPKEVAVVGVDDVKYAKYLRVPLTTYRQPCRDIAREATDLMFSRILDPKLPARTTYLDGELITRKSCGCNTE